MLALVRLERCSASPWWLRPAEKDASERTVVGVLRDHDGGADRAPSEIQKCRGLYPRLASLSGSKVVYGSWVGIRGVGKVRAWDGAG